MQFETLATGYGLLEGPRTDDQNRLYYSDVRGGGVFRRSPDGRIETLIPERKFVGDRTQRQWRHSCHRKIVGPME